MWRLGGVLAWKKKDNAQRLPRGGTSGRSTMRLLAEREKEKLILQPGGGENNRKADLRESVPEENVSLIGRKPVMIVQNGQEGWAPALEWA